MDLNDPQRDGIRELASGYASLHPSDFVPPELYHYTSAQGLRGILESGKLRATNFAYLNDAEELSYGKDLALRVLRETFTTQTDARSSELDRLPFEFAAWNLDEVGSNVDYYIASFCEEADLLSQWRGYGHHGSRYCIGFDVERMPRSLPTTLHRAVYDVQLQERRIKKALAQALSLLAAEPSVSERTLYVRQVAGALGTRMIRELCGFKHPGFHEEREWRLVHEVGSSTDHVMFDTTPQGILRPFVELNLSDSGKLPISQVIVGSSPFPSAVVVRSTELLLRRSGYRDVKVTASSMPLRA